MRTFWALLLALALAGCDDGLGFGSGCSAEMNSVRRQEGRAPDDVQRSNVAGDHTERWYYYTGTQTRVYTFQWGVSRVGCQTSGPAGLALIPLVG